MKLITTILFFIYLSANAETYYISNAGSDGANGTSTGTSWQTIAKINSFAFGAGDFIYFKKGDTWNEKLIISSSGSSGNVITFGSYGEGAKPVITGLQTLSGFTNVGNIWSTTATNSVPILNTVLIDGAIKGKGRYPNNTLLYTTGGSSTTEVTTGLTGTPNYTGAEIAIGSQSWVIDVSKITNQSTGILTVSPALSGVSYGNNGYRIQNIESVLDVSGEWCYDSTSKVLKVYSTTSPSVQISTIDTLVYIHKKDYITFDGISFNGANMTALSVDTSNHVTIQNCSFNFNGRRAIHRSSSTYNVIKKDSILNSLSVGIWTDWPSTNTLIDSNYIKNTGMLYGMASSGALTSMAMFCFGNSSTVTNNRIDSVGYNPIYFNGTNSLIKNNYITNFCYNKSDGAGIYTFGGLASGSTVRSNIILNGLGGINGNINLSAGIYLDGGTVGVLVDSNTIYNCYAMGIVINQASSNTIKYNTVNNPIGVGWYYSSGGPGNNLIVTKNIFYTPDSTQTMEYTPYTSADFTNTTIDSNYYLRPVKETNKFRINATYYSYAGWVTASGWDANSYSTPSATASIVPLFYYNSTLSDTTILLSGTYVSATGTFHTSSVTIKPFQSKILFLLNYSRAGRRIGNLNFQ